MYFLTAEFTNRTLNHVRVIDIITYLIVCIFHLYVGSSPFTYTENDGVREGENIVRVRAQCLGQANSRPTTDFAIGKYMELVSQ